MDHNLTPNDKDKVGVYFIRNKATNEFYIGSGQLQRRLRAHERLLLANNHYNSKLQRSFNNNPEMELVGTLVDIEGASAQDNRSIALELEQSYIVENASNPLLLNMAMKVDNPSFGTKHTEEHKAKIGKASKQMWETMSDEQKKSRSEKISKAHSAMWVAMPQEEKARRGQAVSLANTGVPLSEEHKKKVGDFFRGKELSSVHKEKIGNALRDKPKDPIAVQNAVNARKEKGSYKSNKSQILACSHPVIADGEVFPSLIACAKAKGV